MREENNSLLAKTKEQAEKIAELETEVEKARKVWKVYEKKHFELKVERLKLAAKDMVINDLKKSQKELLDKEKGLNDKIKQQ